MNSASPPTPPSPQGESISEVFKIPTVRTVLLATICGSFARAVLATALGLQVFDITKRKLDLGWLGLAEFLPALLLVLVTGSVADHFDRRQIANLSYIGEAAAISGMLWYSTTKPTSVAPILALVVVWGGFTAFVAPATRSLLPAAVPNPALLPQVSVLSSISWQVAGIGGPLVGAFAYVISPKLAFAITIVLLLVASLLIVRVPREVGRDHLVHKRADDPKPTLRTAVEGLGVIRRQPILFGAITLDLFAVLFGGAVALLPAIVAERHWGKAAVGILKAAGGIGAAVVTVALARKPLQTKVGKALLIVVALFGAATIVFGLTKSIVIAVIAMAVLNGADSVSVFIRTTLVPLVTPPEQRGRVLAVEGVFIGASNELGAFESGVAAQALGTVPAIVLGGVATIAIVGLWWFVLPALRNVDRFSDLRPSGVVPRQIA